MKVKMFRLNVLPLTREWIEMNITDRLYLISYVLPLTREWIEITEILKLGIKSISSPSYEGVD